MNQRSPEDGKEEESHEWLDVPQDAPNHAGERSPRLVRTRIPQHTPIHQKDRNGEEATIDVCHVSIDPRCVTDRREWNAARSSSAVCMALPC